MFGILHSHDREPRRALHSEVNGKTGIDVPLKEFEDLVGDAVDSLPEEFLKAMTNVAITVELMPDSPIAMDEGLRFAIREGGRTVGSGVVTKILA